MSRCFFFSSRRRHTRCSRDWSSDVCSSDLGFDRNYWSSLLRDLGGELLGRLAACTEPKCDGRPFGGELQRESSADSTAATGDERSAPREQVTTHRAAPSGRRQSGGSRVRVWRGLRVWTRPPPRP